MLLKQLCNHKGEGFSMAFRVRKPFGDFRETAQAVIESRWRAFSKIKHLESLQVAELGLHG